MSEIKIITCNLCSVIANTYSYEGWKIIDDELGRISLCPSCAVTIGKAADLMASGRTKESARLINEQAEKVRRVRSGKF